ncbi:calcineurin-like phosphoesterase C-terminal domain-containing protein [Pontibacter harenae]|uniref:calcineurin-like phosphoesterase C-terminal domain-containing protein n=1 Tax=Pontibacter harenae TaxID=2894083 RepID=UPI001E4493BD|nr:calcineurin-like phosphoesterase family protein [Pontibacter harenae]MCC9168426.1 calcineurin-like phosphoesterase family protein [Pontibacter harenae]
MKKTVLVASSILFALAVQAQTSVKGYVFEDANGNGKKERRENGVAQVAVTNGREVVLTDKKGRYELPIGSDNIISVMMPSGYKVALNKENLPQFYYNHKPSGSPDLKFKGVAPTGKLPKSVDFALMPTEDKEEFTALIFGDPQPYTKEEVDFFARGIVSEVEGIKDVPFGLSLGDLVGNNLNLFNPYIEAVKKVGIPWYNLLGNHDLDFDAKADSLADETFEAHFGPANYAFNYGKVHFIVLDDVLYPDPRGGKSYWGGFRKDQLDFIENDLKFVPKDHLVVLAFHVPLSEPDGDAYRDEDRQKLFDLLKDFPHTLSLSAHTHLQKQDFFTKAEGWRQEKPHHHYNVGTTSGDWYSGKLDANGVPVSTMRDGTPKGYAFINFKGNEYMIDYKVAGRPKDYQIQVFAPKVVAHGRNTSAGIFANFFMGSEQDEVLYRIDGGKWIKMVYQKDYDPDFVHSLQEWDYADELMPGRRPSNAAQSTHLWRGNIPTKLELGEHTIEVKATDMFGRTFTQKSSYRIQAPITVQ